MKYCQRCGQILPDWETHDICEACDREIYDETANIEAEIAKSEADAYEKWCYEQSQIEVSSIEGGKE